MLGNREEERARVERGGGGGVGMEWFAVGQEVRIDIGEKGLEWSRVSCCKGGR